MSPWSLAVFGLVLFFLSLFAGLIALQARRRGYSFLVWFLASLVSLNPLVMLAVLTVLPDARKRKLRRQWRAQLEAQLESLTFEAVEAKQRSLPDVSVGDRVTVVEP
jgi:hypothetical protein